MPKPKPQSRQLRGLNKSQNFSGFPFLRLNDGPSMPVKREGRVVIASTEELNRWLDRDVGLNPSAHVAIEDSNLRLN